MQSKLANAVKSIVDTLSTRDWLILLATVMSLLYGSYLFAIILLNLFALNILEKKGVLDQWNATKVLGFILMIRTNRGQKILEKISHPRRFWRIFGEISLWICICALFLTTLLLIFTAIATFQTPELESIETTDVLLIPGVSSGIPLFWPLISLIFALVIHEYGHGIQMRAHGMRVRSFGLLITSLIPIGAFAEPEAKEIAKAPLRERMRTFSAGPAVNLIFAFFLTFILAIGIGGIETSIQGAYSAGIVVDGPADNAGLEPYDIIVGVNETVISNSNDLHIILNSSKPNDVLLLHILPFNDGEWKEQESIEITLGDKFEHYRTLNYSEEDLAILGVAPGDSFMGVSSDGTGPVIRSTDQGKQRLMGPFYPDLTSEQRIVEAIIHPIQLLSTPLSFDGEVMSDVEGEMLDWNPAEKILINGIFWFFWINFILGFANLIPVIPFDGGHIMRDSIQVMITRTSEKLGIAHPQKASIFATKTANIVSLLFIGIFLIPILFRLFS